MRSHGHCRSCVGLRLQTGLAGWHLQCCRSLRRLRLSLGLCTVRGLPAQQTRPFSPASTFKQGCRHGSQWLLGCNPAWFRLRACSSMAGSQPLTIILSGGIHTFQLLRQGTSTVFQGCGVSAWIQQHAEQR